MIFLSHRFVQPSSHEKLILNNVRLKLTPWMIQRGYCYPFLDIEIISLTIIYYCLLVVAILPPAKSIHKIPEFDQRKRKSYIQHRKKTLHLLCSNIEIKRRIFHIVKGKINPTGKNELVFGDTHHPLMI